MDNLQRLLDFLNKLQQHNIFYQLNHIRPDTIMVLVVAPGQRWEIEFLTDGSTEIEIFYSNQAGVVSGDSATALLEELFIKYGE